MPAQKCKRGQFTACNVSDRFGENRLLARCPQHAVDYRLRIGQKLIKTGLHYYVICFRQSRFSLKVPYLSVCSAAFQVFDKCATEVQTRITDGLLPEIPMIEHGRPTAKIQNARVR